MLHSEYHNHNPKIKQTRQFFPSPEQFDFWGYVFVTYHPRDIHPPSIHLSGASQKCIPRQRKGAVYYINEMLIWDEISIELKKTYNKKRVNSESVLREKMFQLRHVNTYEIRSTKHNEYVKISFSIFQWNKPCSEYNLFLDFFFIGHMTSFFANFQQGKSDEQSITVTYKIKVHVMPHCYLVQD